MQSNTSRTPLTQISIFLGIVWIVFLADRLLPLEAFGIVPRSLMGLSGVFAAPFLHANLQHITANSLPLVVLLFLFAKSDSKWKIKSVVISLLGGALLWIFGRDANHIGASILIFGLASHHIVAGITAKNLRSLFVAIIVGVFYGSTLFFGVLPTNSLVSWDGHLMGAIAGAIIAYRFRPAPYRSTN